MFLIDVQKPVSHISMALPALEQRDRSDKKIELKIVCCVTWKVQNSILILKLFESNTLQIAQQTANITIEDHSKKEGNKMLCLLRKLWPLSTDWAIQSYWEDLESKV